MRYVSMLLYIQLLFSCSNRENLFKSTRSTNSEPYVIFVVDPNNSGSFYYKLYDSLNIHITKINGSTLEKDKKDFLLRWLHEQFDNDQTGLGKKASSAKEIDRTTDEFLLNISEATSNDKVNFSVSYKTDPIPKVFLYPDLWKKAVSENGLEDKIIIEKKKYQNGPTLIRKNNGLIDTLYSYGYKLPIDITLNYYTNGGNKVVKSKFTIPAETAVYHQLRF